MRFHFLVLAFSAFLAASVPSARAGDAEADWHRVEALDAGPSAQPHTADEARTIAGNHLDLQEQALRAFLVQHSGDAHAFEARMRLSRLLSIRASFQHSERASAEASALLDQLGKIAATPEQHAEVDFARITNLMRTLREPGKSQRDELLAGVRNFQNEYPADRRLAALLAETATLFDSDPATKGDLLAAAQRLATDPELKRRIGDDLKRLDLLWKEVPLRMPSSDGKVVDVADFRGRPVVIIFFAAWSPPAMAAVDRLQQEIAKLPRAAVQVIGVSLDEKAEALAATVHRLHLSWPIGFDAKSWESPVVRSLGINTLPTVWILDNKGRLRVLNASEDVIDPLQTLLKEP